MIAAINKSRKSKRSNLDQFRDLSLMFGITPTVNPFTVTGSA